MRLKRTKGETGNAKMKENTIRERENSPDLRLKIIGLFMNRYTVNYQLQPDKEVLQNVSYKIH